MVRYGMIRRMRIYEIVCYGMRFQCYGVRFQCYVLRIQCYVMVYVVKDAWTDSSYATS